MYGVLVHYVKLSTAPEPLGFLLLAPPVGFSGVAGHADVGDQLKAILAQLSEAESALLHLLAALAELLLDLLLVPSILPKGSSVGREGQAGVSVLYTCMHMWCIPMWGWEKVHILSLIHI